MMPSRPTHGTQMWSGPRRAPVPVIAPAEEQAGSHVPSGPPRRRTDGTQMFTQFLGTAATVYGVLAALNLTKPAAPDPQPYTHAASHPVP